MTSSPRLWDVVNGAGLTFDRIVPRSLVHKQAVEEVLLCDYKELGVNEYVVSAHLPRCHTYFNDVCSPFYDFTVLGEILRQSGLLTGHCFHDVRPETQYIFRKITGHTECDDVNTMRVGDTPTELHVHYSLHNLRLRRGRLTSFEGFGQMYANGKYVGSGNGHCQLLSRGTYGALREMMRDPDGTEGDMAEGPAPATCEPLEPSTVGRRDTRNVVIGAFAPGDEANTYTVGLVIRPDHRVFFDHPQDHVPGTLLIEAFRQLAIRAINASHGLAAEDLYTVGMESEFSSFVELDAPAEVVATVGDVQSDSRGRQVRVEVAVRQSGATVAESALTLITLG